MIWIKLTDLPSQKLISREYKTVYWKIKNNRIWHQHKMIKGADVESFEVRVETNTSDGFTDFEQQFFGRDKHHIYHAWSKQNKIDRDSFEEVGNNYWKDKNLVYFEYETSLRPLKGSTLKDFIYLNSPYARDSQFAYYYGKPIRSCKSPKNLKMTTSNNKLFAQDKDNIYYEGAALKNSDPATWTFDEDQFSHDSNSVYYCSSKLPRVNIESWKRVSGVYSKDKSSVYYMWFKLKDAQSKTWLLIGNNFSRDSNNLYFTDSILEGLGTKNF